ncbi:MAG: EAL domain-containing protein [Nitrosomonas sp.]|nr:MAG: EAL domain-containing protein [Nitrosomonas sp.]
MPLLRKLQVFPIAIKKIPMHRWVSIGSMLLLALTYALLAKIIIENFAAHGNFSPVWPPSGLALAALLVGGHRLWPGIALGVFLANYLAGKSIESNLVFVIGNTAEPLIAIWLLKHNFKCKNINYENIIKLKNSSDYSWLALSAILSVSIGTMLCIIGLSLINELSSPVLTFSLLVWWIANLLGIAIFTPFFLIWKKLPKGWFEGYRAIEALAFIGLTIFVGQIVHLELFYHELGSIARGYWIIVCATWGAIRFGRHGITLVLTITFVQAMIGAAIGIGLFGKDLQESGLINMQLAYLVVSVLGLMLTLTIYELRKSQDEMRLALLVYHKSSEAMMVTDANKCIISVNPAFTEVTGYQSAEVIGKTPRILSAGLHSKEFYQTMWQSIGATGKWQGEIQNRRKNGELFTEVLSINTLYNLDGTIQGWVGLFSDISERKKKEELIWRQANYDQLTGLPNRRMIYERLNEELKKCQYENKQLALILINIDRFREINDTLGHQYGDLLLKEVSQRLATFSQGKGMLGRLGSDEFAFILSNLNETSLVGYYVNSILEQLAIPYHLENEITYLTASIGIALYPTDATDIATMLKCANHAMHTAKREGRNCFHHFTNSMQETANTRMRLANDLRHAVKNGELLVHYQPIIDLSTGYIQKAEALVRWQHPKSGIINPDKFIPIAEETGLIVEIGDWIFHQAATQVKHCRATYNSNFQISVNKSPFQFRVDSSRCHSWFEHLKKLGLPGESIVIEITESSMMEATNNIYDYLLKLRDNGMQVALDDFGTGYSSLAYLKKFDIDYIKIDKSFVQSLSSDSDDLTLCEAMVVMAHKLNLRVIAEGVETWDQFALLKSIGCDFGQGYLFSKPIPANELNKLFAENTAFIPLKK